MPDFKIGWAEESLVPEKRVSLAGQFYERISEFVESPITVTACAVECSGDCAILLSVDIVSMQQGLIDEIRRCFAKLCPEVDPERLIIFATHTHTSIGAQTNNKMKGNSSVMSVNKVLQEFFPAGKLYKPKTTADDSVMTAEEGVAFVSERVALAAKRAWESRQLTMPTSLAERL